MPEDWVGAYKIANEKISWRNGIKIIIHLAAAGAHGKLFTRNDKYPEEEKKLINELEKCVEKKSIFLDMLFLKTVEIHLKNAPKFIKIREALMKFLIFSKIKKLNILMIMMLILNLI